MKTTPSDYGSAQTERENRKIELQAALDSLDPRFAHTLNALFHLDNIHETKLMAEVFKLAIGQVVEIFDKTPYDPGEINDWPVHVVNTYRNLYNVSKLFNGEELANTEAVVAAIAKLCAFNYELAGAYTSAAMLYEKAGMIDKVSEMEAKSEKMARQTGTTQPWGDSTDLKTSSEWQQALAGLRQVLSEHQLNIPGLEEVRSRLSAAIETV